ncbi:MAG: hypothetical protein IJM23_09675 [Lachnospiraceae bacterium]|nr:hypothetical protein [Lachnospiraceae bacterium]
MNDVNIVETLNAIIRLQSTIIDELFVLLSQHITVDELDKLPVIDKINEAAKLGVDVDLGGMS